MTVLLNAQALLANHNFNGLTYRPFNAAQTTYANTLAALLDSYNNNGPCPASVPTPPSPLQ